MLRKLPLGPYSLCIMLRISKHEVHLWVGIDVTNYATTRAT